MSLKVNLKVCPGFKFTFFEVTVKHLSHYTLGTPLYIYQFINTIKIGYSCSNNIHNILNNHNRRLQDELNRYSEGPDEVCGNCWRKRQCSLGRWCNLKNVVYQACISSMEHNYEWERSFIGLSTGNWKQGLYKQRHSFSNPWLINQTTQSKYFWDLRDRGLTPQI